MVSSLHIVIIVLEAIKLIPFIVIFPLDFQKAGHIIDDEMHDIMVKPLPVGCRLTVSGAFGV